MVPIKYAVFLFSILVATACGRGDEPESSTVTVPFQVLETKLKSNEGCVDQNGAYTTLAYVYANFDGYADDIDGQAPDPIMRVPVSSSGNGKVVFNMQFENTGKYRVALTCEATLDNPSSNDNLKFIYPVGMLLSVGDVAEIAESTPLPPKHLNSNTLCFDCHTVGENYEYSFANHNNILGDCADCHRSP